MDAPGTAWRWLQEVVRARLRAVSAPPVPESAREAVEALAARSRLESLLFAWGADERGGRWREAYLRNVARGEQSLREGIRVAALLEDNAVPCIPMRGPFAGRTLYGDVGARWFTDLDLLVPAEHAKRALEALRADGWEMRNPDMPPLFYRVVHLHYPMSRRGMAVPLDLHWALDHPLAPLALPYEEIFRKSRPPSGPGGWRRPCPEHEWLRTCFHLGKELGGAARRAVGRDLAAVAAEEGQLYGLLDLVRLGVQGAEGDAVWRGADRWKIAGWASRCREAAGRFAEGRCVEAPRITLATRTAPSRLARWGAFRGERLAELRPRSPAAAVRFVWAGTVAVGCLLIMGWRSRRRSA